MLKEKIIQSVFKNIFDHVMSAVLGKKTRKARKKSVGLRFFINIFEDLCSGPLNTSDQIYT